MEHLLLPAKRKEFECPALTKDQVLFGVAVEGNIQDFAVAHAELLLEDIPDKLFVECHRRLFYERKVVHRGLIDFQLCVPFDLGHAIDDGMLFVELVGRIEDGFPVIEKSFLFIKKVLKDRWLLCDLVHEPVDDGMAGSVLFGDIFLVLKVYENADEDTNLLVEGEWSSLS